MEDQRNSIVKGHEVVIKAYNKALDLDDHIIDRYDIAHKENLVEKKPLPISVPKGGADISDILEDLVENGEFEIPFMGKKGKGMVIALIRKNKTLINDKATVLLENAMEQAQNPEQLSEEAKKDLR